MTKRTARCSGRHVEAGAGSSQKGSTQLAPGETEYVLVGSIPTLGVHPLFGRKSAQNLSTFQAERQMKRQLRSPEVRLSIKLDSNDFALKHPYGLWQVWKFPLQNAVGTVQVGPLVWHVFDEGVA